MISQSVEIHRSMEVPAKEVKLKGIDGSDVEVKPPSVHIGYKPIPLLLISYKWRGSQVSWFCVSLHVVMKLCEEFSSTYNCFLGLKPHKLLVTLFAWFLLKGCTNYWHKLLTRATDCTADLCWPCHLLQWCMVMNKPMICSRSKVTVIHNCTIHSYDWHYINVVCSKLVLTIIIRKSRGGMK